MLSTGELPNVGPSKYGPARLTVRLETLVPPAGTATQ